MNTIVLRYYREPYGTRQLPTDVFFPSVAFGQIVRPLLDQSGYTSDIYISR